MFNALDNFVQRRCCTEGCPRRGGDVQDEAHHSVRGLVSRGTHVLYQLPALTVAPGGNLAKAMLAVCMIGNSLVTEL